MKKISILFVLCLMVLGLTACGRPARPGKLAREARKTYGSATVVSKVKTPIGYSVKDIGGSNGAPNYWSSPVTFYYFKAFDGGEFYMGDFYLKNPNDPTTIDMVNNYAQRTYPDD